MEITIIQVFKSLGVDPTPDQSWSVGNRIAAAFRLETNTEPPKELRPKTSGGGSHCFAVYPLSWYERIAKAVRSVADQEKKQDDLFGDAI